MELCDTGLLLVASFGKQVASALGSVHQMLYPLPTSEGRIHSLLPTFCADFTVFCQCLPSNQSINSTPLPEWDPDARHPDILTKSTLTLPTSAFDAFLLIILNCGYLLVSANPRPQAQTPACLGNRLIGRHQVHAIFGQPVAQITLPGTRVNNEVTAMIKTK